MQADVLAVVVTYNRCAMLMQCMTKLQEQSIPCDVLVIDNASTDQTQTLVPPITNEHLFYQRQLTNTGGAGGFHAGMRKGVEMGYSYIWIMDDDAYPAPDALGIVPVLWEDNLPQIAIEYVAHGIPILVSDAGGAQELCTDKFFVFQNNDVFDAATRLDRICKNTQQLSSFWESFPKMTTLRDHIKQTTYSQYAHAHHEKDLLLCREVLSEQCPEYVHAFDAVMKRRSGHRFNMMIANRNVLDRYCGWLFPILFELERRIDVTGYDAYNRRVVGFLAERLLDVWLEKADVHFRELPVVNIERENWLRKGTCFILRKIKGGFRKKDRTS